MDFRTTVGNQTFAVGVSALVLQDNQLLTYRYADKYLLPGGAILVGETSEEAVCRELLQELQADCTVRELAFVVENHFANQQQLFHTVEWHYFVELQEEAPLELTEGKRRYPLEWLSLNQLHQYEIRPQFLATALPKWNGKIEQYIVKQNEE